MTLPVGEAAFDELPSSAAWRHGGGRDGLEVVFIRADGSGHRFDGHAVAIEDGQVWTVRYSILVDENWATRSARAWSWSVDGERETSLEADGSGHWWLAGLPVPGLDGCFDVDFESSACTNTFPVHRLGLRRGEAAQAPAAYVRAPDLRVERLDQQYVRVDDDGPRHQYDYAAPRFDFGCRLLYDPSGLVIDYPGIATRLRL